MLISILTTTSCESDQVTLSGNITGKITDALSGEPIQGVTVSVFPGGTSRTTGSEGYFEFTDLEAVQYELQARKSGYITNNKIVNVISGSNSTGDMQLTPIKSESEMGLSVSVLNFGRTNNSMSFNIINEGNTIINWNISGIEGVNWLNIAPVSGTIEPDKKHAVKVDVIRENINEYKETIIIVNSDKESIALKITVEP